MLLFPIPRDLNLQEGTFAPAHLSPAENLVTFYQGLAACPDVTLESNKMLGEEEYVLVIDAKGITVTSSCDTGLFRAATSLRQMLIREKGVLPCLTLRDKPDIARRGYMVDISRGRMPKVDTIKRMADYLASLKYNELQLYMEGDCFKYAAYPEETAHFDCLTPEDIRELDAYCKERFIDLVPNQNSFGHMYTWLKKPHFHHLGLFEADETPSTLNPTLPESFDFMCNLYKSLLPHFSSEYVNIGLDEAYGLGKYQIEEYCREKGRDVVFMEWLNKLNDHIASTYGKKVMFWADMIYNYPQSYHMVPKDAVALEWGYEYIQSQRMTDHCIAYRDAGVRYYVCPSVNTHSSYTSRMDVTTFNIRTCAELAVEYGAEGILLTEWGGGGQFGVWCLTPIALCGQYGWNIGKMQDGETFKADFIRASEDYVDEMYFGGKPVSRLMYRMANYYLLEPERVHVCTMSAQLLLKPLLTTNHAYLFDLKDSGDDFYFDNVSDYVRRVMADIEKIDFDPLMKTEIRLTAWLIEIGSEVCKLKLHPEESRKDVPRIVALIDKFLEAYEAPYLVRNYRQGIDRFLNDMRKRREELLAL